MKKFFKIILIIIAIVAVSYAFLPQYAQKALIYTTVDIDDFKIFDNRVVEATNAIPWEKDSLYGHLVIPEQWMDSLERYETVSYVVIKNGKLVFEDYWGGYAFDSYSNSFSAAKTIVGLCVLAAIDDGYIESLDQSVCDFIPEFDSIANKNLTLRDIMTMSSGLSWVESYGGLFNSTTEAYYGKDILKQIYGLTVEEVPGKYFKYKSGDPEVLALVVRNATGMELSEYVSDKFWGPMGAEHDALWSLDHENGMEKAYCCFYTNARDFARFGQLLNNKGSWNGKQLVSSYLVEELLAPASHLLDENGEIVDFYGYQTWMLNHRGHDVKYMRGILGQYVFVIPDMDIVVVRQGHLRSDIKKNHHTVDVFSYLDLAIELMGEN